MSKLTGIKGTKANADGKKDKFSLNLQQEQVQLAQSCTTAFLYFNKEKIQTSQAMTELNCVFEIKKYLYFYFYID